MKIKDDLRECKHTRNRYWMRPDWGGWVVDGFDDDYDHEDGGGDFEDYDDSELGDAYQDDTCANPRIHQAWPSPTPSMGTSKVMEMRGRFSMVCLPLPMSSFSSKFRLFSFQMSRSKSAVYCLRANQSSPRRSKPPNLTS